jgi:FAD synthetase
VNSQSLSFNGGKDCTVLLALYFAALKDYTSNNNNGVLNHPIRSLYVSTNEPFPQVDEFIEFCIDAFSLDLMKLIGTMKTSLQCFLDSNRKTKVIHLGTRRTDPHSGFVT